MFISSRIWRRAPLYTTLRLRVAQEFFDAIEATRLSTVESLVKRYRTIPQLLGKMEEIVVGSNTGRAPKMAPYYQYWERTIFHALNSLVLGSMDYLRTMMLARCRGDGGAADAAQDGENEVLLPLFLVRLRQDRLPRQRSATTQRQADPHGVHTCWHVLSDAYSPYFLSASSCAAAGLEGGWRRTISSPACGAGAA